MNDLRVIFESETSKTNKGGSCAMMGEPKKFQEKYFNCNQTGRRSADCRKPKTAKTQGTYQNAGGSGGESGSGSDLARVKCNQCTQFGHFTHSYPTKKASFRQAGRADTGSAYFVGLTNCEEVSIFEEVPNSDLDPNFFDEFGKESAWIEPDPELTFSADDESSALELEDWTSLGDDIESNESPTTDENEIDDDLPDLFSGHLDDDSDDESDDGSLPALSSKAEAYDESDDESDNGSLPALIF
jgi:hypothetical protein